MKICPRCSELQPDDATHCPRDGAALRPIQDPLIGKTIGGRYRLISRLGVGGMSSVYLARHVMIDRLMAIKTLRRDLARDPVHRDRFLREARAVNRINHENIVEITDFGETDDGLVYLVMEYVPGELMLKALADAPFPTLRALHIAEQVGAALARAHEMAVIHRDLKPENILLVTRKGGADFVKILDFGIAKILDAPSITGSQQIFGTPGYISPEYIQSSDIDGRADLYSLGVILYEMCTGALPFDYEYPGDLLVKHVTDPPVPPRTRNPHLEPAVEALILRCLEKDPACRFRDAFHFLDELALTRERIGGTEAAWGAMGRSAEGGGRETAPGNDEPPGPARPQLDTVPEEQGAADLHGAPTPIRDTRSELGASGGLEPLPVSSSSGSPSPGVSDTQGDVALPRSRVPTEEYRRPTIPEPPSGPTAVEIAIGLPASAPVPKPSGRDPAADGLLGVRRWRQRFHALRAALDEVDAEATVPPPVARSMAFAARTLEALEDGTAEAESDQGRLELLGDEARDFRATLGRAIDPLARDLSKARRALERVVARRNELRTQREAVRVKVRHREATEGQSDALLWELAAIEEEVTQQGRRCDELEGQLAELRLELERRNEDAEGEIGRLVSSLDSQLSRLEPLAAQLREPLAQAEALIREHWSARDSADAAPARPLEQG